MEPVALICDAPAAAAASAPIISASASASTASATPVAVRVHDACATSEIFGSRRCDCREQLHCAMAYAQQHGGVIIYLQQEGRGIGLANKIAAYALQEGGVDTVDANRMLGFGDDLRRYEPVKTILDDIGVAQVLLMTNNPRKVSELTGLGVDVRGRIPIIARVTKYNAAYLRSKQERMEHMIDEVGSAPPTPTPSSSSSSSSSSRSSTGPFVRRRATAGELIALPFPNGA
jgi:GTP cyclohydrolase II